MNESQLCDELNRLRIEVEALRIANEALQQQLVKDAEQTGAWLKTMEEQSNALRAANERHRHQNDFIRRVMDTVGALMIVLGPDGRILRANRRCSEELADKGIAMEGCVLDDWLHPEEKEALSRELPKLPWPVYSPLFESVRRKGVYECEHRLLGLDGNYIYYWLEASLQHSPQGKEEGAVVCATDITMLKQQETRLIHSKDLLKEAQRIAQLGHWEFDLSNDQLIWSEEIFRIFNLDPETPPSSLNDFLVLVHPDDRSLVENAYRTSITERKPYEVEHRLLLHGGRVKWVNERAVTYYGEDGEPLRSVGTVQDITEQHLFDEQLRLAASVFENSLNGILITDAKTRILKVNQAFTEILGYSADDVVGRMPGMIKSGHHDKSFYQGLWRALREEGKWHGEIWDRCKNGELIPLWQSISSVRDSNGQILHYIGVFNDLSEQKQNAQYIHRLAYYDALTDLPNRQLFNDRCSHSLDQSARERRSLALLFLDLDRFKYVNDSLGHPAGDELLRIVAQRLKECLRNGDTVARLGGDEFIILLENTGSRFEIELVARKVLAAFARPFMVHGHKLEVGTSIGISCYPKDGDDADTLIKHADLALYQAKEHGRGNFQFFEARFTERAKERLFLESELREALKQDELILYYQPLYSMADGRLIGAEALLRWRHGDLGMVTPDKFIPIAEDSGLIIPIGEWVLRTACRQAVAWLELYPEFKSMAVNLSGVQIERSDILTTVTKALTDSGLSPEYLELEITETYIMRQAQRNIRVLEQLRALDVTLAIDDFGTGQSSLSYLKRLPVNKIKIDRSFVQDIPEDSNDMAITQAILVLGHSLNLTVLAEGVETADQVDFLKGLACDEVQGFYYSKPLDMESFSRLLSETVEASRYGS